MDLAKTIRDIPNFPIEGVLFKDITTLLKDPAALHDTVERLADKFRGRGIEQVIAIESRGFIFGAPLAYELGAGLVPIRKPGKLPAETISVEYSLEYGQNTLQMHVDALASGQKVLIVDDLLATGGSARAAIQLAERLGAEVVGLAFVIELTFLHGRDKLQGYEVTSLIAF